jgi:putative endonuclease
MHHVYILYSKFLDRYYVGGTENIEECLRRHNSNHKGFTGRAADWKIIYKEDLPDKQSGLAREKQVKNWKSRLMIEKLVNSNA